VSQLEIFNSDVLALRRALFTFHLSWHGRSISGAESHPEKLNCGKNWFILFVFKRDTSSGLLKKLSFCFGPRPSCAMRVKFNLVYIWHLSLTFSRSFAKLKSTDLKLLLMETVAFLFCCPLRGFWCLLFGLDFKDDDFSSASLKVLKRLFCSPKIKLKNKFGTCKITKRFIALCHSLLYEI